MTLWIDLDVGSSERVDPSTGLLDMLEIQKQVRKKIVDDQAKQSETHGDTTQFVSHKKGEKVWLYHPGNIPGTSKISSVHRVRKDLLLSRPRPT